MKTFTITLPDEFAEFVEKAIAGKSFRDVDHVVMYGLAHVMDELRQIDEMTEEEREWVRKEVRIGIDQADRGELIDGPTAMERLRAKLGTPAEQPS